jgi:S-(hydroxymethyl)glutathione dehydrogenase/alcohol dehydrogenase
MKGPGIDSLPPRYDWDGTEVSAGWITTFSEYTIVSENRLTPVDPTHDFDILSLLGCAVTTGLGIVFNDAGLMPGQSIAVFGAGGVGFNVLQGSALVNAHPIVAVDIQDQKLETAKSFGATHVVNSKQQDPVAALKELTGGRGFDVVVDTTGNTQAFQAAYNSTSNTGKTILAGVLNHENPITIDPFSMHFGHQVIASHGGNTRPDVDIPRYLRLHDLGRLKLKEQITGRFPLKEVNSAIETVRSGEAVRCVLEMKD